MAAVIFPWPSRAQRKAQVEGARRGAEEARRKTVESRSLIDEIRELRRQNHVSEALDQMIARHAREQGK